MLMAHVQLGDLGAAKQELANITSRWGSANLILLRVNYQHSRDPEFEERYIAPFAKAGVPEWADGITFDETKPLSGKELVTLFEPPYKVQGDIFTVTDVKVDLLCLSRPWKLMGRAYCAPVYRDPTYINDFVMPSIHHPGYTTFSVKRGK